MTVELSPPAPALRETILQRRSIRAFRDEPLPRSLVEDVLRDALWAPSPHNSQPWRFTVLFESGDKQRLAAGMAERLEEELRADGLAPKEIERISGRSRARISTAPVVILCSLAGDGLVRYDDERRNELEWLMAVQSVGAVLQTLFLAAHARGIGTCWMAAPMYCEDLVCSVLSLPPEYRPQALTLMGYAANEGKVRERRPFKEVVDLR